MTPRIPALIIATIMVTMMAVPAAAEERTSVYLTAGTYADHAGQTHPILHTSPGGVGTYEDPVTLSVGSTVTLGATYLAHNAGRRIYLPALHQYGIVEDTYGRGTSVRVYVGGQSRGTSSATSCAARVTGRHAVIIDPGPGYPVTLGPAAETGCRIFPDTVPTTQTSTPRSMPSPFTGGIRRTPSPSATTSTAPSTSSTTSSPATVEDVPAQPSYGWLVHTVDRIERAAGAVTAWHVLAGLMLICALWVLSAVLMATIGRRR